MNHNIFTKNPHSFKPYRHSTKKQVLLLTMLATALDDQTSRSIRIGLVGGVDKQLDYEEVELMKTIVATVTNLDILLYVFPTG